jgi:ABC-type glycerol-3-phosphate transport system substrate-binding protein
MQPVMGRTTIASLLLGGLLLAACGGAPAATGTPAASKAAGAVEITLWHTQSAPNSDVLNSLVSQFNASHPGITVRTEFAGSYNDEYAKLLAAAKGGGLPDLAVAYENVVAELMKGGVIVPLDSYISGTEGLGKDSLDDIFPGYLETNRFKQFGNQTLSFPFTKSQVMAYYNSDLLRAAGVTTPPQTWQEYGAALKKVADQAKASGQPFNGAEAHNTDASNVDFEIMSRGGALVSDDQQKTLFDNPQGAAALSFDAGLVRSGEAYLYRSFDWQNDFAAGKTAAILESSTSYAFLEPLVKKAPAPVHYQVAAPPSDPDHKLTVMYGANVAIFKSTPAKQAAAWQFVKWFTDTQQTAAWSIKTHYLPVRKSAAETPEFKRELASNQALKAAFDELPHARPEPNVAGWQAVRDDLQNAETEVVTGKANAQQALAEAAAKADKALADAR